MLCALAQRPAPSGALSAWEPRLHCLLLYLVFNLLFLCMLSVGIECCSAILTNVTLAQPDSRQCLTGCGLQSGTRGLQLSEASFTLPEFCARFCSDSNSVSRRAALLSVTGKGDTLSYAWRQRKGAFARIRHA